MCQGFSVIVAVICIGRSIFAHELSPVQVSRFEPEASLVRAGRPATIKALLKNDGDTEARIVSTFIVPQNLIIVNPSASQTVHLRKGEEEEVVWQVEARQPMQANLKIEVRQDGKVLTTASLTVQFLPPVQTKKLDYIPEPKPLRTTALIGAMDCPLWESGHPEIWGQVVRHPERTPALGLYDQANPEVADWETKWAVEHGISFFAYCWYRDGLTHPIKMKFNSALDDALFKSRFQDKIKFALIWINNFPHQRGILDDHDLTKNLAPFWIKTYFQRHNYLLVDNKPVLFVFDAEALIRDCGGMEKAKAALAEVRKECRDAGFYGLYLAGQYWEFNANEISLYQQLGFDYYFAYVWHMPGCPSPGEAVARQVESLQRSRDAKLLPIIPTVSQGWTGWGNEGSVWRLPPADYELLLRQAKKFMSTLRADQLGSKMLLLDNWNEWSEGHYIAPHREYGFGYLDAVRRVFSAAPESHLDLLPEDIGMGPYTSRPFRRPPAHAVLPHPASSDAPTH